MVHVCTVSVEYQMRHTQFSEVCNAIVLGFVHFLQLHLLLRDFPPSTKYTEWTV